LIDNLPEKREIGVVYRENKTDYNCCEVNDSVVELGGKLPFLPATQTLPARMTPVGRVANEPCLLQAGNAPNEAASIKNNLISKALTQIKNYETNEWINQNGEFANFLESVH
jgi:hypothetical protein